MNFSLCLDGLCLLLLASVGISSPVAAAASSSLDTAAVGHTVWTTSGKLIGHPSVKKPAVLEFLGIPYAQPPVGDLRFAPPQSYSSRETFTASDYVCYPKEYLREIAVVWDADSADCPYNPSHPVPNFPLGTDILTRIVANFASQTGNNQSEDCLTLNVWTKSTGRRNKPVLVWLYGGRFTIGSTNSLFYQGQNIADTEDVVIVSVNYRVNVFGFSGAPGITQNVGLLDQRLAIEWVRDNIAAFGGNPELITIFGQSAGGASVDYYSYAYTKDPIVSGLISHSGTALSLIPNTPEISATNWYTLSNILGCGSSGNALPCVRSKSFIQILQALAQVPGGPGVLPVAPFHPTVDNKIVFGNYEQLSAEGKFARIPYLNGNLDNEAGYYRVAAFGAGISVSDAGWDQFNLAAFTCPAKREAEARAKYDVPTWRYRYFGIWRDLTLYPTSGAYHGSDLNMLFGVAADVSGQPTTHAEDQTSAGFMKAWAAFAADPKSGLKKFGWPMYSTNGKTLIALALKNNPKPQFVDPDIYDVGCAGLGTSIIPGLGAF